MPVISTIAAATARAFGAFKAAAGGAADEFFNYVTLLLHGDGTNGAQNNTFLDSSTNNFTITRNGNTTQGTFSPFSLTEGQWSNYFGSTTANLKFASNAAFGVGTGNFTVEFFLNISSWSGNQRFFMVGQSGTDGISFGRPNSDNIAIDIANSRIITYGWTPTVGRWYHLALVRSGTGSNQTTLYIDGVSVATGTSSGSVGQNAAFIGGLDWATSYNTQGYISNLRFSNSARTITVPTTPYTSDANTIILSCQSNRFKDNSANAFAITVNGNTSIQPFSPFAPSAAYSAATNGGSGYFDGSGDYLTVASNAAFATPADFTWEAWVYRTTTSDDVLYSGNVTDAFVLQIISNAAVVRQFGVSNLITSSATVPTYAWTHIAVARSGTTLSLWINGSRTSGGTTTNSTSFAQNGLLIGVNDIGTNYLDGYLSGLRLVKGTAVYDPTQTSITVPTAPPTAITNTSLLLNFTNAGILDNTGRNDLETVGNAQISTSVKKFGTGSLAFDGSGDYLLGKNNPLYDFGSGDFTIECWLYRTADSGQYDSEVVGYGNPSTLNGWHFGLSGSSGGTQNRIQFNLNYSGYLVTSTATVSANVWTHIAVTRSGTAFRLFINGVQDGSATSSGTPTVSSTTQLYVGTGSYDPGSTNRTITGYIDDLRITKGVARYTSNFTPPTAAFEDQ